MNVNQLSPAVFDNKPPDMRYAGLAPTDTSSIIEEGKYHSSTIEYSFIDQFSGFPCQDAGE